MGRAPDQDAILASDVCALDAEDAKRARPDEGAGVAELAAARGLQLLGFNVLLVSAASCADDIWRRACADAGVDTERILRVPRPGGVAGWVFRVAHEYLCPFALPAEPGKPVAEGGGLPGARLWTLPLPVRQWVGRVAAESRVSFWFDARGRFQAAPPAALERRLAARLSGAAAPPGGVDAEDPDCNSCVVAVVRGARTEHLLAVFCGDASTSLFASAKLSCGHFLGHDVGVFHTVDFTPESDPALAFALRSRGGCWAREPASLVMVGDGQRAGLRAVGVGSNQKKRGRAASLALAATAALQSLGAPGAAAGGREEEAKVGPPELLALVRAARLAQQDSPIIK